MKFIEKKTSFFSFVFCFDYFFFFTEKDPGKQEDEDSHHTHDPFVHESHVEPEHCANVLYIKN